MNVDLRPILMGKSEELPLAFSLTPDVPPEFTSLGDATVKGSVHRRDGGLYLDLAVKLDYETKCARCLAPVKGTLDLDFTREIVEKDKLGSYDAEENGEDLLIPYQWHVEFGEALRDEIFLSFPMRVLCSEDCPGLCPVCGKPRRLGCPCGQENELENIP